MSRHGRSRNGRKKTGTGEPDVGEQPGQRLVFSPGVQKLITLFFLAATIAGLLFALNLAFTNPLTSDSANAGLFPMEVMKGNFEYVFPANNPYFFTDYALHLIIQPLTGYSPTALILTSYFMYVGIVLVCGALALRLAGRMEALAAAALVANLPFLGLRYVLYPLYHDGTILFILLSVLLIYADRPPFRISFKWRVLAVTLLQFLGVFSDTLMLPLFTLPLIVYSAYRLVKQRLARDQPAEAERERDDTEGNPIIWLASAIPALAIYALKPGMGQLWPGGPILAPSGADLGSAGSLLQHPEMFSEYIAALVRDAGGIVTAFVLFVVVLLVVMERKDRFLQSVLAFGGFFMLVGFMSMTMAGDAGRYLTPVIIFALLVAATGTMRRGVNYIPLVAIIAIVLVNFGSNVLIINEPHEDLNKLQQGFVNYLDGKGITHAYSDYWSANIYTYLSGGRIMVEPVYVRDGRLMLQSMNSAPRWAEVWPDGNDTRPVIITITGDPLYDWTQQVNENHLPETAYQVSNGWVYIYNGTLPAWPAGK